MKFFCCILLVTNVLFTNAQKEVSFYDLQAEFQKDYDAISEEMHKRVPMDSVDTKDTVKMHKYGLVWSELHDKYNVRRRQRISECKSLAYPDFNFEDFEGNQRSLSDFKDKKLVLNFNYMFCDWCVNQIDSILKYKTHDTQLIVLLYDNKSNCTHLAERFGDKVIFGFISRESARYYALGASAPANFLLDENRTIYFFTDPFLKSEKPGGLYDKLKEL